MRQKRRVTVLFLFLFLSLLLSACESATIDDLFSLPQHSQSASDIEALVAVRIAQGCEYAAPTSGSYRQSLQLYDSDGDGRQEAFAFLRDASAVPFICIYRDNGSGYREACVITGDGNGIGRIEYADLNGDGGAELLVTWQIGTEIRVLNVYSLDGWAPSVLYSMDSTAFFVEDLETDGIPELLNIRFESFGQGRVEVCRIGADHECAVSAAELTAGVEAISGAHTGLLADGTPALFVDGVYGGGVLTDLVIWDGSAPRNLTSSDETWRENGVACADTDGDGFTEVPAARQLYAQTEGSSTYWLFDWYRYDSRGNAELAFSTYHCYSDGWYLVIPESLRATLTVRREDSVTGERIVVLSSVDERGTVTDLVRIYTLTGENRYERMELAGRFALVRDIATVYAGRVVDESITQQQIEAAFHLIYSELGSEVS